MKYNKSIIGTGWSVPPNVLTNQDLSEHSPTNDKWVVDNLGIHERRKLYYGVPSDMGLAAAEMALDKAGLDAVDIDMIIVAITKGDMVAPPTSSIIRERLGAVNSVVFDVNAVCSGYLFAQDIALRYNDYDNILLIGIDQFSMITDYSRRDCVFFGDGAGSVVLSNAKTGGVFLSSIIDSDSEDHLAFHCKHGESFNMRGRGVYERAKVLVPDVIQRVMDEAGMNAHDIDYVIPHQPSTNILKEVSKSTGIPYEKFLMNMDKYGNTAAASIPLLLAEKWDIFKKGDIILFATIGSGWSYGAAIYKV